MNIIEGGRIMICVWNLILIGIGGMIYLVALIFIGGIRKKDLDLISPRLFRILPRFLRKNM